MKIIGKENWTDYDRISVVGIGNKEYECTFTKNGKNEVISNFDKEQDEKLTRLFLYDFLVKNPLEGATEERTEDTKISGVLIKGKNDKEFFLSVPNNITDKEKIKDLIYHCFLSNIEKDILEEDLKNISISILNVGECFRSKIYKDLKGDKSLVIMLPKSQNKYIYEIVNNILNNYKTHKVIHNQDIGKSVINFGIETDTTRVAIYNISNGLEKTLTKMIERCIYFDENIIKEHIRK